MQSPMERIASALLTLAAVAIAVVLIHREFFASAPSASRATRDPEFQEDWREALPVARLIGDNAARVTIVEFADLECPFCKSFNVTLRDVQRLYPRDVAVAFIHTPLRSHRFARPAARAAECALLQKRFKEFVDVVYQDQDSLGLKSWSSFAADAGVRDTVTFASCVKQTSEIAAVEAGVTLASKMNVNATPTIIVNGWRYPSPPSDSELVRSVRSILGGREPFTKKD